MPIINKIEFALKLRLKQDEYTYNNYMKHN